MELPPARDGSEQSVNDDEADSRVDSIHVNEKQFTPNRRLWQEVLDKLASVKAMVVKGQIT